MKRTTRTHVERAIAICGSQKALGAAIGRSQQYVSWLLNNATEVPAKVAVAIETATGRLVKRSDLCPDLWPKGSADADRGPEASEQAA